jgi:hypothetical protein
MRTSGVKLLDPVLDTVQIDWLLVPAEECRDIQSERHLICRHFRKPHEPWGSSRAFVLPVRVRRSRRKVLFSQQSGIE